MKEIKLTQGKVALVDDEDFNYLNQFKWQVIKPRYIYYVVKSGKRINGKNKKEYMHRIIMNTPSHLQVDHIDHNGLNNQKSNLRNCNNSQNNANKILMNEEKYRGICWDKSRNKWMSSIRFMGKNIFLGRFSDPIIAAKEYDRVVIKYHGEFAHLNFPNL
jgi:hypothetical protein